MSAERTGVSLVRRTMLGLQPSRSGWQIAGMSAVAVVIVGALSTLLISSTGSSPTAALHALYTGSIASQAAWTTTLLYAAPLLIVAAGSCISSRSGAFNIGQEGQVLIGALAVAAVTLKLQLAGWALLVIGICVAALAGGFWAWLSSLMYRISGVNIVVSTLLMTFVAQQLISYAVNTSWFLQEPSVAGIAPLPESKQIATGSQLRSFGSYPNLQLSVGLILALALTVAVAVTMTRTRWGFRLKMVGLNPLTARHAGVRVAALGGLALAISGAFAGIAGAVLLTSPVGNFRLQPGVSSNIGWDGLLVALVARNRPIVAVPFALLFGILRSGGNFLSSTGVPPFLVDVVKGLLVLAFVAPPALADILKRRAATRRASASGRHAPALQGAAA
ncbi:MAG: ABC transporter permease [Jatrophihabitantaceae bacterium]